MISDAIYSAFIKAYQEQHNEEGRTPTVISVPAIQAGLEAVLEHVSNSKPATVVGMTLSQYQQKRGFELALDVSDESVIMVDHTSTALVNVLIDDDQEEPLVVMDFFDFETDENGFVQGADPVIRRVARLVFPAVNVPIVLGGLAGVMLEEGQSDN